MSRRPHIFWRNVALAFSGTAVAQAIPLIGSLVIARIFAPQAFGLFATWLGLASLFAVVLTGRLEAALAIVADGQPRAVAVCVTLATAVLGTLLLSALLLLAAQCFPQLLRSLPDALVWQLAPAALLIAALNTWQSWAAAESRLRALAAIRISQAGAVTLLQIGAGWLLPSALGLAFGHMAGVAIGLLVAARMMPLARGGAARGVTLWRDITGFWRQHRRFPLFALPADAINAAAAMLPLLILSNRFGAHNAGFLALALRVLGAPIGLLGAAVLDVFKRSSAASFREHGHCRGDYQRTFKVLGIGALAVSVVIVLLAEPLFALFFGARWRYTGTIAIWLMPMFALRFVASPLSYVFYVAGKQHVDLAWQVGLLLMTLATLHLAADGARAIQAYSAGYSLLYIVYLALSWRFSKGKLG